VTAVAAPCRRPEAGSRRGARAGFTLMEMTAVLIIIALGTAIAVPMIEGGFDSREVRRAARQIAATMHYCRGEAVARGRPQELVVDLNRNSIHAVNDERWAVLTDRAVIEKVRGGNDLGQGVVQILFFPNGSTSGAEVVLASRRDRFQNRLRVSLDPLLGTVRVTDDVG
jgi:general secretion pathway protein H